MEDDDPMFLSGATEELNYGPSWGIIILLILIGLALAGVLLFI